MRFVSIVVRDVSHREARWRLSSGVETLTELFDSAAAGRLKPVVAERFPLAEATRAHDLLERGGHAGKVVLVAGA